MFPSLYLQLDALSDQFRERNALEWLQILRVFERNRMVLREVQLFGFEVVLNVLRRSYLLGCLFNSSLNRLLELHTLVLFDESG